MIDRIVQVQLAQAECLLRALEEDGAEPHTILQAWMWLAYGQRRRRELLLLPAKPDRRANEGIRKCA